MNRLFASITGALSLLLSSGCGNNVQSFDPDAQQTKSYRATGIVPLDTLLEMSRKAAIDAMNCPNFAEYLEQYTKANANTPMPLLQLGEICNNTNDSNFQGHLVANEIADKLFKAKILRVLPKEALQAVTENRELKRGKNLSKFKESRVEMPDLIMNGVVTTRIDRKEDGVLESTVLSVHISDLRTGENVWRYSTSIDRKQKQKKLGL